VAKEEIGCQNQYVRYAEGMVILLYNVIIDFISPIQEKITLLKMKNKEHTMHS